MTDPRQTTRPNGPEPPPWDDFDLGARAGLPPPRGLPDLTALVAIVDALRRMVPAELQTQFAALQREFLLTLRALIDWYLERLDSRERPPEVEEIPID
jgi:hypothetical protein